MIYLDTSVLFSLHFRDANTPAALALVAGTTESLLITSLCELETVNAFSLRVFRKEMLGINRDSAVRDLEEDIRLGVLHLESLPESAFTRAKVLALSLTPTIGVRAADLLHVAAAMELDASALYTFDRKQHRTARAAGLNVNRLS
jgi:uncharacterized protein